MLHVRERKRLYAFFARLFSYPDRALAEALAAGEGADAARLLRGKPAPDGPFPAEELEVAFTGLFLNRLGGAPAPPYGSVYLEPEGRLMGATTRKVNAAYHADGLAVEGSAEPPDYLATELEYLYYLVEQEETAIAARNLAAARAAVGRQREFCKTLLHPWVPVFCRRIEEDEQAHPLYRWGAQQLAAFCRMEGGWLEKVG
jgi:TorA maturation chaperone TorD